ncbi:hypothetical protein INR49_015686, partial [Caranx melampygus]
MALSSCLITDETLAMILTMTDNHINGSLINFSSQSKDNYSGETFSDYSKMIVFPFLNPQMIK